MNRKQEDKEVRHFAAWFRSTIKVPGTVIFNLPDIQIIIRRKNQKKKR
jgi:hypothetical protein